MPTVDRVTVFGWVRNAARPLETFHKSSKRSTNSRNAPQIVETTAGLSGTFHKVLKRSTNRRNAPQTRKMTAGGSGTLHKLSERLWKFLLRGKNMQRFARKRRSGDQSIDDRCVNTGRLLVSNPLSVSGTPTVARWKTRLCSTRTCSTRTKPASSTYAVVPPHTCRAPHFSIPS